MFDFGQCIQSRQAENDDLDGAEQFGAGAGAVGCQGFQCFDPSGGDVGGDAGEVGDEEAEQAFEERAGLGHGHDLGIQGLYFVLYRIRNEIKRKV